MIERDIRMAGFKYIDKDAKIPYGAITKPLIIKDSGNKANRKFIKLLLLNNNLLIDINKN